MDKVVPWADLVALVEPYQPESGRHGQQPFAAETMLRLHFLQQWLNLSDPAMEETLHDVPLFRDFAGLSSWDAVPVVRSASLIFLGERSRGARAAFTGFVRKSPMTWTSR